MWSLKQGLRQGEAQGARHLLRHLRRDRFGAWPAEAVARVEQWAPSECVALSPRLLGGTSLAELGLAEPANGQVEPVP